MELDTGRGGRILGLVEAAYEPAGSLTEWLDGLTEAMSDAVGTSMGTVGRLVQIEPRRSFGYASRVPSPALARALREHEEQSAHRVDLVERGPSLGLRRMYSDAGDRLESDPYLAAMRRGSAAMGVSDVHHLTAIDDGLCVSVGMLMGPRATVPGTAHTWTMAAIHLAAAFRLQRSAQNVLGELPKDGAVLAPDGRIVDADGSAKDRRSRRLLRETVRRVDAARARARSDGEERALQVWRGLIEGTWSIVDRHDHDGRRYIVAVPNPASAPRAPRCLSPREAQVASLAAEGYSDKWIAYTLGIARTTVATHLQASLRKLALPSRLALARAFGSSADGALDA
jgi:DNA-binding CsgD family transcriptional regulator